MARSTFDRIDRRVIGRRTKTDTLRITSASSETLRVDGMFEISMEIHGQKVTWPMAIIKDLSSEIILGDDLLAKLGACVDVKKKTVTLDPSHAVCTLVAKHKVVVKPFAIKTIKVVTGKYGQLGVIEPRSELVVGGVQESKEGAVSVVLHNGDAVERTIEQGEELGLVLDRLGVDSKRNYVY
jgi:hypothetical protein